jgi:hypothetical protein
MEGRDNILRNVSFRLPSTKLALNKQSTIFSTFILASVQPQHVDYNDSGPTIKNYLFTYLFRQILIYFKLNQHTCSNKFIHVTF